MSRRTFVTAVDWQLGGRAPEQYQAWAEQTNSLFSSPPWAQVMLTLADEPIYAWNERDRYGLLILVFRKMGMRIGYLNFPVLGRNHLAQEPGALRRMAADLRPQLPLDLLRANFSFQDLRHSDASAWRAESWIAGLQNWHPHSKKLRRDLKHAHRACATLTPQSEAIEPEQLFQLYRSTVVSHGGTLRYSVDYFRRLSRLTEANSLVHIICGVDKNHRTQGFATLAVHDDVAYYLHGAVATDYRAHGLSDWLLYKLIERAQTLGCQRFNLMASPWEQPGLIRYKSKWGQNKSLTTTYDLGLSAQGRIACTVLRKLSRPDQQQAGDWLGVPQSS